MFSFNYGFLKWNYVINSSCEKLIIQVIVTFKYKDFDFFINQPMYESETFKYYSLHISSLLWFLKYK